MTAQPAARALRQDNRRRDVLDAAARLFRERGLDGTSMRDIAAATGMLPGSLYYHFPSKEELFVAVHEEGIRWITQVVEAALEGLSDPWERLEAATAAHLRTVLAESDYAAVFIRAFPTAGPLRGRLTAWRDGYEAIFRELVEALPLPGGVDRKYFRLALLGALNWSQTWYRPNGETPEELARALIRVFAAERGTDAR